MSMDYSNKRPANDSKEMATAKRPRPNYDETIEIVVGDERTDNHKRFTVHKTIICNRSPFFKAACSGKWPEGQEGVVKLPTHDPPMFEAFLHWVYSGEVDLTIATHGSTVLLWHRGELWSLAHYLQCIELCNRIINYAPLQGSLSSKICENEEAKLAEKTKIINRALKKIPLDSNMGRFIIDSIAAIADESWYETYFERLPQYFMLALLKRLSNLDPEVKSALRSQKSSRYYEKK